MKKLLISGGTKTYEKRVIEKYFQQTNLDHFFFDLLVLSNIMTHYPLQWNDCNLQFFSNTDLFWVLKVSVEIVINIAFILYDR